MKIILLVLAAILFFVILAGLVLVQLPLAYYLNDKWLKMKNRSAKVWLVVCAILGFGCYSYTIGGISRFSAGNSGSSKRGKTQRVYYYSIEPDHGVAKKEPQMKPAWTVSSRMASLPSGNLEIQGYEDKWTELARKYLRGTTVPPNDVLLLNDKSKNRRHFELTDREWSALQSKLARDPIVRPRLARRR